MAILPYFTSRGAVGLPCDLQTKLDPWPAAVGSQAGQWEEGESMEIKPRAPASGPRIPETGSSNPSEREEASCKHGLGFLRTQGPCWGFYCAVIVEIIIPFQEKPEQGQACLMLPQGHRYHSFIHATDIYWLCFAWCWECKNTSAQPSSQSALLWAWMQTPNRFSQFSAARNTGAGAFPRFRREMRVETLTVFWRMGISQGPGLGGQACSRCP